MLAPQGHRFVTRFSTKQFNYATRWILHNGDQKVAAFILPATCRPEGYLAAKEKGTLQMLSPGETRHFSVTTGGFNAGCFLGGQGSSLLTNPNDSILQGEDR